MTAEGIRVTTNDWDLHYVLHVVKDWDMFMSSKLATTICLSRKQMPEEIVELIWDRVMMQQYEDEKKARLIARYYEHLRFQAPIEYYKRLQAPPMYLTLEHLESIDFDAEQDDMF